MDKVKRGALLNTRDAIVDNLDAFEVSDDLYSKDVIQHVEYRLILDEKVRRKKILCR